MGNFTMTTTLAEPYDKAVERVREQLGEVGFGVLTEIDIKATMKNKLDVHVAPKIILGACQPNLAHQALEIDSRVAALMPCNVVVSDAGDDTSRVEVLDPDVMPEFTGTAELKDMASEARERLSNMLDALGGTRA